jgi:hypothetical protein
MPLLIVFLLVMYAYLPCYVSFGGYLNDLDWLELEYMHTKPYQLEHSGLLLGVVDVHNWMEAWSGTPFFSCKAYVEFDIGPIIVLNGPHIAR